MNCPRCHKPLLEGVRFCTSCGAPTPPAASPEPPIERAPDYTTARDVGSVPVESVADGDDDEMTIVTAEAEVHALDGRVLDGKYELLERLGVGGMGSVYRARRVHIGDEVAVKILHPKYLADQAAVGRFRREARAAAQLHHPNVVTIHDYGESEASGEPVAYIVMELVTGLSLRDLLRNEGKLEQHRAVCLMRDICAGVASAHRRQIVHRDIKPDNIIVLAPDEDHERETVKVVDFGIAKLRDMATDHTLTLAGAVIGTPFYMSPEQCLGEPLDARADVYSLGALLYEMLAGSPPFSAPTATGVIAKHLSEAPPRVPSSVSVSPALATAISRALSKDPEGRQKDAGDFARELLAADATTAAVPTVNIRPGQQQNGAPFASQAQQQDARTPLQVQQHNSVFDTPTAYMPGAPPISIQREPGERRKSRAGLVVFLFMLAILAGAGVGAYLILSANKENRNANVSGVTAQNTPANRPASNANARNANTPPVETAPFQRAEAKILNDSALAQADLAGMSPAELRLLLNTVYARHGRIFVLPDLDAHFRSQTWYRPRPNVGENVLSGADRANVQLLSNAGGGTVGEERPDPEAARGEVDAALEGAIRPGSPEFDEAIQRIRLDFVADNDATTLERPIGDKIVTMKPTIHNLTNRAINGLELRAAAYDLEGKVLKERTFVIIPNRQPELEPNKTYSPELSLEGFKRDDAIASLDVKITGLKFKQ